MDSTTPGTIFVQPALGRAHVAPCTRGEFQAVLATGYFKTETPSGIDGEPHVDVVPLGACTSIRFEVDEQRARTEGPYKP
jgi:hypothetical protein